LCLAIAIQIHPPGRLLPHRVRHRALSHELELLRFDVAAAPSEKPPALHVKRRAGGVGRRDEGTAVSQGEGCGMGAA
jgi:hypothetical protein